MDYYCGIYDKYNKPKGKYKLFESNIHKEIDKCEHILLTIENPIINEVEDTFYSFSTEHNKKVDYFL